MPDVNTRHFFYCIKIEFIIPSQTLTHLLIQGCGIR